MAGEYSYPLLVELEKTNITKIKIKLVKYFQSKKSNGGDCEVDYENGSGTAVLRFRTEEGEFGPITDKTKVALPSLSDLYLSSSRYCALCSDVMSGSFYTTYMFIMYEVLPGLGLYEPPVMALTFTFCSS
uniref:PAR14-like first RRM domain-containing protein n=1 Tax=Monopterus albus TaxID=43700 RepID=A0A3Q3KRL1_MONAL